MKLCSALLDFKEVCYFLSCGFTAVTVESNFDPVSLSKTSIKTFQTATATGHLRLSNTHILTRWLKMLLFQIPTSKGHTGLPDMPHTLFYFLVFFGGGGLQEMQRQTSQ